MRKIKMKLTKRKMTKIEKRLSQMNPLVLWTSESFPTPQQNHFISVPYYHKTYQLWTIRYESYDIDRKQNFNVTKTHHKHCAISRFQYCLRTLQFICISCFGHFGSRRSGNNCSDFIMCSYYLQFISCSKAKLKQNDTGEKKNDENKESTESSESNRSLDKCYFPLC